MLLRDKLDSWGILHYGEVAIENIKAEVADYYDQWLIDTSRQRNEIAHEKTFSYSLLFADAASNIDEPIVSTHKNSLKTDQATAELTNIFNYLESEFGGTVIRADLVSMQPKSRIRMHKDRSDLLFVSRRFHVPIKSNSEALFTVNEEVMNMLEGHIYEINNSKYHSVVNNSKDNRIHLIIDLIPEEYAKMVVFE